VNIVCVGGGPAGLCAAALIRAREPRWTITVVDRLEPRARTGFGVVLPDKAIAALERADPVIAREVAARLWRWRGVRVTIGTTSLLAQGTDLAAIDRCDLLDVLRRRCATLGVRMRWREPVDHVDPWAASADLLLGADGASSRVRERYADRFEPSVRRGRCRFIWLATSRPLDAFTFWIKRSEHGPFCVHAYRYRRDASTFIAECSEATWRRAGLDTAGVDESIGFLEALFSDELRGHRLWVGPSSWRCFPTVRVRRLWTERVVLLGDAAHTAHFSVGSGTRLAIDDAIALAEALAAERELPAALAAYEQRRRPAVERLARAARASQDVFERLDELVELHPGVLACRLLARSGRMPRFVKERRGAGG
jgi:anthraniloyl-CoA monooxygenase